MANFYQVRMDVLYNDFPKLAKVMPQTAADVQGRAVLMIVQVADPATPVLTGNLKGNKTIEPGGHGRGGFVHWHAPYAGFVNFGTRKMPARPFITDAVAQVTPIFIDAMEKLARFARI